MEGTSENQDGRGVISKETFLGTGRSRLDLIDTGQIEIVYAPWA